MYTAGVHTALHRTIVVNDTEGPVVLTPNNRKNNHTKEICVFKLVKNEVLHRILGLICQKFTIQDGRRQPFWIFENKHIKEKNET